MQELTDIEFLRLLDRRGIQVRINQDRLRINAPAGALDIPLRDELARRKGSLMALLADDGEKPTAVADKSKVVPLTYVQKGIWLVERFHPGTAVYSIPQAFLSHVPLELPLLQEAVDRLLERHEILRSYVAIQGDEGVLHIASDLRVPVGFTDLSTLDESRRDEELAELLRQESRRPFNLAKPPLFRCHMFRLTSSTHVMHLNVHHILADEWSLGILERDVRAFYVAAATGRNADLPRLTMQYSDYAIWEQEEVRRVEQSQLAYWKAKLANAPAHLDLPFSKPRPAVQSFAGEIEPYSLAEDVTAQLRKLARSENASLFMLLLAAFSILLHRYTGKEDFCIGSPVSGRTRLGTEDLIGLFINTLVFRCQPQPSSSFRQVLRQVRDTALEAYSNSNMPFQKLVAELHPERDAASSAIFQMMFQLHTAGPEESGGPVHIDMEPGIAKFDLTLQLTDSGKSIHGGIEYRTDLFERADIQQFASSFSTLLEEIAHEPDQSIARLNLLSPEERQRILVDWNATERSLPRYSTVVEWFRSQAAASPDATAVRMGNRFLSYAELDKQSELLAEALRKRGVGRAVVVGLYVTRTLNMVVALLAILKSGGAYLPLDPAFPAERVEFLLSDAAVPLILTETSLKAVLPESDAEVLALGEAWEEFAARPIRSPDEPPRTEDLAYLIYTSGSTGKPKGTEITHYALVNLLSSMLREPGLTKQDTFVAVTTLSFDIAGLEIFGPLVCGANLVIASREQAADPRLLAALLEESGATVLQATPSTWRMLVESGWSNSKVRMWCGGEALPSDLAQSLLTRGCELWNLYGPTETTIWSAACRVTSGEGPILIGRPIANTQMYILDAQGEPVPAGVDGELYIAGDGVARGYWKRPELTKSRFVPDRFSKRPNGRMYRTGDLARYRRDGQIQLLGRTDQQIKLRGHRVELGEIESVLLRHRQVAGAMVFLHQDAALGSSLVAFALAKQGQTIDVAALVAFQRGVLPAYMVVSQIVLRKRFLLTPNGKIDRKAMIASFERPPTPAVVREEPRDDLERVLVEIWQESFGKAPIGIDDDFFTLGGHSLLALQVFNEIERRLGKMIMLSVLFQAPTIRQLASVVRG